MKQLNSHMFEDMYKKMGIDLDTLGCVMLDLVPLVDMRTAPEFVLPYLHESYNKKRKWIKGWVVGETPHITLLYGLMENAHNWQNQISNVLSDWKFKEATIEEIGYFDSSYEDEECYCIVAHIKKTPALVEGNERLEFLPHINTFTGYKPHMTICYLKKDKKVLDDCLIKFNKLWKNKNLKVIQKINLGYKPGE